MKKKNVIKVDKQKKKVMIDSIKEYFYNEREEELGDLAAGMILDFFLEELATEIYNKGVYDAYEYSLERIEDVLSIQKY
ncbi:DUF2164 domain-containing protein [Clostridium botulinum]|uniref:DUF2164 domain-containing protein n=1 Tax=Clostridium botulinum (strain Okra / Type B1) TaxID=498213 RepID=B1IJQ8_CLOBK|nr:DUF2164 domain-containing protein [Clostridium botulinum]EKX80980.1 hypothetical protein CFSAN001628_003167 [Clostridium botulinum CFSAN001628]ACA45720.1 conserved hypothetical protein [Clostridium botulinum B1 str. Okra]MBD5562634.1 DUF2164 domain-containing protein [Clostridium botulinum]MBD5565793.1 DUF2164 domain-containing protein [Clostridium botulinum]MBD5569690.1 DUF2164 domain-containing protein [Clostridium botulinum]